MRVTYQDNTCFISTGGRDFDPNGPVLLFIHGSGQSHLTFMQQGRFFANRGWQVLNPDLPAHGYSQGTPLQSISEMADWYKGLLDSLKVSQVVIIGHSQGCLVGLEIAKKYPESVSKLCFIAGSLAIPVNDALLDMAEHKPKAAYQAMVNWAHGTDSHLYDHSWPGQTHIEFGNQVMASNAAEALFADLTACNSYHDGEAAASAIQCDTMTILGGKDKMTPLKAGQKMAQALTRNACHIIEDAGHFLPSERPMEVNRHIRNFIS